MNLFALVRFVTVASLIELLTALAAYFISILARVNSVE